MATSDVIAKLRDNKDFVFLIGNGINRHYDKKAGIEGSSWEGLLNSVSKKLEVTFSLPNGSAGLTCPEFFSLMECFVGDKTQLKEDFKDCMGQFPKHNKHDEIVESLQNWGCPVLTTNYDDCLDIGETRFMKHPKIQKNNTHYPIFKYKSTKPIHNVCEDFAVWHIHGSKEKASQMVLSLDNYINYIRDISPILDDFYKYSIDKNEEKGEWSYANSWLYPFLTKPLFIVGLKLDVDEIFLRWLLVRRKYLSKVLSIESGKSYYAFAEEPLSQRKKLFLKQVGIEPLRFKKRDEMYQTIFETN